MRNGMKRAALGLAAAALCLGLMGCSLSSGFADYDVSGYFQALLDSSYKNQNENYATVAAPLRRTPSRTTPPPCATPR